MLKELWRKTTGQHCAAASEVDATRFNLKDHLTHTGQYHLERLQMLVELRFEKTFTDSADSSLRELIQFASRIQDQDIQRELLLLYLNCPPAAQSFLRSDDIIDSDHYIHTQSSDPSA